MQKAFPFAIEVRSVQDTIESKWHWRWGDYDLDHRIPLMDAFGRYFDVVSGGRTLSGQPWERPERLEMEAATKSFKKRERRH